MKQTGLFFLFFCLLFGQTAMGEKPTVTIPDYLNSPSTLQIKRTLTEFEIEVAEVDPMALNSRKKILYPWDESEKFNLPVGENIDDLPSLEEDQDFYDYEPKESLMDRIAKQKEQIKVQIGARNLTDHSITEPIINESIQDIQTIESTIHLKNESIQEDIQTIESAVYLKAEDKKL